MTSAHPEERASLPMLHQRWRDVAFVHWRFEPAEIAPLLPAGLSIDSYDGSAWVTLTPFAVDGSRPCFLPSIPGLSSFVESNVRTYVVGPDGRDGLWFFTLETNSLSTTLAARSALGVPYRWAAMELHRAGDHVTYSSRRRLADPAPWHRTTIATNHRGHVADRPLAEWLTGRWRAWSPVAGRLLAVPVEHEPWPISDASLVAHDDTLLASLGLPTPTGEPLVHAAPGVTARLGWPTVATPGGAGAGPRERSVRW
jgi:uncharacterized protein YqjF (DUF2071 family)